MSKSEMLDTLTTQEKKDHVKSLCRFFKDFPKAGVNFLDIMPVFKTHKSMEMAIDVIVDEIDQKKWKFEFIAGVEARGFLLGALLANRLHVGFIPIRKKGKLPGPVYQTETVKEYGGDCLELQQDSDLVGKRVLIFDDVIATGGTMLGTLDLLKKAGARVVGSAFLADIVYLNKVQGLDCEICAPLKITS
ncbi:Adenine phosphoribosyltransferase [Thelohanellus kitauei]|uniref:Adenine phosphoribosyltransferase n=1 Tax=Thelohanellus kitauei TaxID=669202 RepID=A0A0C2NBM5_THEKT|nr:Adenine phosphoribosyltransferase [Thelohanellus kitauei]